MTTNRISSIFESEDTIFHYTTGNIAINNILPEKLLKLSIGMNTNDPREYNIFDLEPYMDGGSSIEEFNHIRREAERCIRNAIISYKFACFCKNGSSYCRDGVKLFGYSRLRMWAQYGENFNGICIAFSAKSIKEHFRSITTIFDNHVSYYEDLENIDIHLSNVEITELIGKEIGYIQQWATNLVQDRLEKIFFSKHVDYRDENEFRIVVCDPRNEFERINISGCIQAVILGDRTNDNCHKRIRSLCEEINCECKQAKWNRGRLHLVDI